MNSIDQLPPDPETTTRESPRGPLSVAAKIDPNPKPPVLVDGLFVHTERPAPGSFHEADIRLPNINCDKCTLQVIQWMGEHRLNATETIATTTARKLRSRPTRRCPSIRVGQDNRAHADRLSALQSQIADEGITHQRLPVLRLEHWKPRSSRRGRRGRARARFCLSASWNSNGYLPGGGLGFAQLHEVIEAGAVGENACVTWNPRTAAGARVWCLRGQTPAVGRPRVASRYQSLTLLNVVRDCTGCSIGDCDFVPRRFFKVRDQRPLPAAKLRRIEA